MIDEIGLGVLRVEEIRPGNVGVVAGAEGIATEVEGGQAVDVESVEIVGEKRSAGEAYDVASAASGHHVEGGGRVEQARHFLIHGAERKGGAPREAVGLDVERAHTNFGTHGAEIAEVGVFIILSADSRGEDAVDEIIAVASVEIDGGAHAIVPQAELQTEVPLVHLLPREVAVLEMAEIDLVFSVGEVVSLHNAASVDGRRVDGFLIHLGGEPIAKAQGEFRDVAIRTHEGFAVDVPFCADVPGG